MMLYTRRSTYLHCRKRPPQLNIRALLLISVLLYLGLLLTSCFIQDLRVEIIGRGSAVCSPFGLLTMIHQIDSQYEYLNQSAISV